MLGYDSLVCTIRFIFSPNKTVIIW